MCIDVPIPLYTSDDRVEIMSGNTARLGPATQVAINDFAKTVSYPVSVYQDLEFRDEGDDSFKYANTRKELRALMYELVRNTGCASVHMIKSAGETAIFAWGPYSESKDADIEDENGRAKTSIVCPIEEVEY